MQRYLYLYFIKLKILTMQYNTIQYNTIRYHTFSNLISVYGIVSVPGSYPYWCEHDGLTHLCLNDSLEIDTFDHNFWIQNDFTKYFKKSHCYYSEYHSSSKYFSNLAFACKISSKLSGCIWLMWAWWVKLWPLRVSVFVWVSCSNKLE